MKKKKTNIILIIGVLGLWVVIGMRFFNGFGGDDELAIKQQGTGMDMRFVKLKRDSFELLLQYKDPFKGIAWEEELFSNPMLTTNPKPVQQIAVTHKPTPDYQMQWVRIQYKGRIKNKSNEQAKLILQIDENEYLVETGQEIQGFKIDKASFDSVWIKIGETVKSFSVKK